MIAYEDGGEREFGNELGDAKAARSRTSNVISEGEGRENKLNWEFEYVNQLLAVTSRELLVL